MMSGIFLLAFLVTLALTVTADSKDKQACLQRDFRSFTHCIRKRNAQNDWCSAEGCTTCLEGNCQTTCKGFNCGICPKGECCDGKKCNACYNNFCCSTLACNYCVRACRDACSNDISCQNSCIPQCQTVKHDIFVVPSKTQTPGKPEAIVYVDGKPHRGNITSGQIPPTNRTATVTINGTDHPATVLLQFAVLPEKLCQYPCNISSCVNTNNPSLPQQNCNLSCTNQCSSENKAQNQTSNYYNLPQGCCHIVHPQQCYRSSIYPYHHCSTRSHQECSNLCTSQFVHLTRTPHNQQNQCHYVQAYPYIYCGQNSVQNCDSCYVCNGQYNPNSCVRQNGCSNICRKTFLPPNSARIQARSASPYLQQYRPAIYQPGPILYQTRPSYQQSIQLPQIQNTRFLGRPMQYG